MRLALSFLMTSCFLMGILAAIGAQATWCESDDGRGFIGFLVALFFVGSGARCAYGLGKMDRGRHLFFPRRHWWKF